jgi:hypothetical protein
VVPMVNSRFMIQAGRGVNNLLKLINLLNVVKVVKPAKVVKPSGYWVYRRPTLGNLGWSMVGQNGQERFCWVCRVRQDHDGGKPLLDGVLQVLQDFIPPPDKWLEVSV